MDTNKPRRGGMPLILTISILIQVVVFGAFFFIEPLRKSTMSVDKQELDERTREVKERARKREEQERRERAEREIRDEHKEALRKEEEHKRRRKMVEKIEEMERVKKEMEELKVERLEEIEQRTVKELVEKKLEEMDDELNRMLKELDAVDRQLPEDQRQDLPDPEELKKQAHELKDKAKEAAKDPSADRLDQLAQDAEDLERGTEQLKRETQSRLSDDDEKQKDTKRDAREADQRADRVKDLAKQVRDTSPEAMNDTSVAQDQLQEEMKERAEEMGQELDRLSEELESMSEQLPEDQREQFPELAQLQEQAQELKGMSEQTAQEPASESLEQLSQQAREMAQATEQLKQKAQEQLAQDGQQQPRENAEQADSAADRAADLARKMQQLDPQALADFDPEQATMSELYDHAAALEEQTAQDYAAARAAELAKMTRASFPETLAKINSTTRDRPDLASALESNGLETVADLNQLREHLDQALTETAQMAQHAQSMMQTASGKTGQQQGQQPSQQQQMALAQAFANSAETKGRNRVTDISQMMRYQSQGGIQTDGSESGREGRAGGEHFLPKPQTFEIGGLGNTDEIIAMALPGRKFSQESTRKGWLYVDTWYVIGPFENHGRMNWDHINPPEYEVDFDAEYPGKDGRELRWQFSQYNTVRITPPDEVTNATYYAYTEVYFEEAADMLLAIASDDAAKVWINDTLAWQDTGLSAWKLDEGFRKVWFKQGFNKILIRVEQGPGVCHWSVLLCPPME